MGDTIGREVAASVSDVTEIDEGVPAHSLRLAWFGRLWALAALAHVVGNGPNAQLMDDPTAVRVSMFLLGLAAIGTLLAPRNRLLLGTLAALAIVTAWLEAPFLPNHWLLATLVSVLLLVSLPRAAPWPTFRRGARWVLLVFYGFAAFAKLNGDFFDPAVSCARFYANQGLEAIGLPGIGPDAPGGGLLPVAAAGIELAVVPLLLFRRTRAAGVALGMCFHLLISFDLDQHFYDFTAVLLALFTLFLDDATIDRLAAWQPSERLKGLLPGVLVAFVYLSVSDPGSGTAGLVRYGAFVLWIPAGSLIVWHSLRPRIGAARHLGAPPATGVAVAAVALLIGMLPYLGVRTATAWNMYANLSTHDGDSNHLVVPSTATFRLDGHEFVAVVATDDPDLEDYVGTGVLVPIDNLRHHLADHPESMLTYRPAAGAEVTVRGSEWGRRQPLLERKLLFSRSIDVTGPVSCQAVFLAVG